MQEGLIKLAELVLSHASPKANAVDLHNLRAEVAGIYSKLVCPAVIGPPSLLSLCCCCRGFSLFRRSHFFFRFFFRFLVTLICLVFLCLRAHPACLLWFVLYSLCLAD